MKEGRSSTAARELGEGAEVEVADLGAGQLGEDGCQLRVEQVDGTSNKVDNASEDRGHSLACSRKSEADQIVALEERDSVIL